MKPMSISRKVSRYAIRNQADSQWIYVEMAMKAYGVISDTHCHNFSSFSSVNAEGVNTRLVHILDEFERCAAAVAEAGGGVVYHAGDLFHVRGKIAPSVLVPTKDRLVDIINRYGTKFTVLGGNHDFEGKNAERIGNAVEAVSDLTLGGRHFQIDVVSRPTVYELDEDRMFFIPWHERVADLKVTLEDWAKGHSVTLNDTLFIHAPLDGVIMNIPDHGLTADYLQSLGFDRVWCGHYHNAKHFEGTGVRSVGAITHQTWSDVGAKAGFWIVTDAAATWHESKAPKFVEISGDMDSKEVAALIPGNYVRAKLKSSKTAAVKAAREHLEKLGAAGVRIDVVPESTRVRVSGAVVKAGATLEASINDYVKASSFDNAELVAQEAVRVLGAVI